MPLRASKVIKLAILGSATAGFVGYHALDRADEDGNADFDDVRSTTRPSGSSGSYYRYDHGYYGRRSWFNWFSSGHSSYRSSSGSHSGSSAHSGTSRGGFGSSGHAASGHGSS